MKQDETPVSCGFDPMSISADQATKKIIEAITPITVVETVSIRASLGRILAKDLCSTVNVPNHTNSAMDGYAVRGVDLPSVGSKTFPVLGASFAGKPFDGQVGPDECVRIMTGAVMPDGTDSVVVQERVQKEGDAISIQFGERKGDNVRYAGEDLKSGDIAIPAGIRLGASHLGLAASLGFAELPVIRRPRVAFFSNGDELKPIGTTLEIGELYDSNRYTLYAMLTDMGVELIDLGVVKDDEDDIAQAFVTAADCADMVITSAGASVGDADYVKQTLDKLGDVSFWKVAIKPGRPLSFGRVRDSLFFGLPGNPVSVMVTFQLFVKPALRQLAGEKYSVPLRLNVKTRSKLKKRSGRAEYQRGILSLNENGETVVSSTGEQGSGILSSMSLANCYVILPTDSVGADIGEWVEVQPFDHVC
ncbi:MAG: molybdopterin molybdenumtransferase MoeA [Gammaproteobacteria bacterium]|nr:molybdopterin molybdenumtransferase MoeA [Gammaproteobacteria bacterium]